MSTILEKFEIERKGRLLAGLRDSCRNQPVNNKNKVLSDLEEILEIPLNREDVREIALSPFVLSHIVEYYAPSIKFNESDIEFLRTVPSNYYKSNGVRVRFFEAEGGRYCKEELIRDDLCYILWNEIPILLTAHYSEPTDSLNPLLRMEVKALSSILFAYKESVQAFMLSGAFLDIPSELLSVDEKLSSSAIKRAKILIRLFVRINRLHQRSFDRHLNIGRFFSEHYEYSFNELNIHNMETLVNKYDISNELLLRTSALFLKAGMLFNSQSYMFAEEACAYLYFAMEGALRLICRKHVSGSAFKIADTLKHVDKIMTHVKDFTVGFDEIYDLRTRCVHPDKTLSVGWHPALESDDYYDIYPLVVDLIYYAITDEVLGRVDF